MTGLVRKATLFSVCGLLAASAAMAGVPSPANSTIGNNINVTGHNNNVVDSRVIKTVTIRDAGNNPIANSTVVINFSNCAQPGGGDLRLSDTQPHHPGALFNCPAKTVTAVTNASGVATFRIAGGANNVSGIDPPGSQTACAEYRADGVLVGVNRVGAFDQNLVGGVNAGDFSRLLGDLFPLGATCGGASFRNRSDLNGTCTVDGLDAGILLGAVLPLNQIPSSYAICAP